MNGVHLIVLEADMTQLDETALNWLLEAEDAGVRYLALRDLTGKAAQDPELLAAREEAHRGGPINDILNGMHPEGYWVEPGPGYNPKYRSSVWALILLAQLGARAECDPRIARACRYALDHTLTGLGQFTASGSPSGTADCLQGNLCWALTALGIADPRLDKAFEWAARSVTGEGVAPQEAREQLVRYYAGKCGPGFACGANNRLPCAWGAVKVMLAFGRLPPERRTPQIQAAIRQGIDFLFSVDPASANYPSGATGRPSQSWWKFGFPVFYVTDILQVGEALSGLGLGADPRLDRTRELIRTKQDHQGRWALEYDYSGKTWVDFGAKHQPNLWVTLRALRTLQPRTGG
jgi:hypothetical protein